MREREFSFDQTGSVARRASDYVKQRSRSKFEDPTLVPWYQAGDWTQLLLYSRGGFLELQSLAGVP